MAKSEYLVNAPSAFGAFGAAKLVSAAAAEYVTYDPANKPSFTAPGAYSIDYRSVDAAGNVETAKTVTFTIAAQRRQTAPVTTGTLDPGHARRRPDVLGSGHGEVLRQRSRLRAARRAKNVNIDASGDKWIPDSATLNTGDKITWSFPSETAVFPHDVWVVAPGGSRLPARRRSPRV